MSSRSLAVAAALAAAIGAVSGSAATAQVPEPTPTTTATPSPAPTPVATAAPTPKPTATPKPPAPVAVTAGPTSIGLNSAVFNATVTPGTAATTFQFEYGTSSSYAFTTPVQAVPAGDGAQKVSVTVGGLSAGTTYHYRVLAANGSGTVRGTDTSFKTLATPRPPYAQTRSATDLTLTSANLVARVDPRGLSTRVKFEWGTSTKYGKSTAYVSAGGGSGYQFITIPVTGLLPNTRYYYRAVAVNSKGTTRGSAHKLTTTRAVSGVVLRAGSGKVTWNRYGSLAGAVSGQGTNGVSIVLIRQDFPYSEPWRQQATQTTGTGGAFSFSVGPLFSTARFQVVAKLADGTTQTSPAVTLTSQLYTKLRVRRTTKRTARLSGLLYPAVPKARVSVQRKTPKGRWVRVKFAHVTPLKSDRTAFSVSVPRLAGRTASYRAIVTPRDGGAHARTTTAVLHVKRR